MKELKYSEILKLNKELGNCITVVENNRRYKGISLGEPQLGRRGLYPSLSTKKSNEAFNQ